MLPPIFRDGILKNGKTGQELCSHQVHNECKIWIRADRKSEMYDYSKSLLRYRKLRNYSHAACFKACHSDEGYEKLMKILEAQGPSKESSNAHSNNIRFGPLMPKAANMDAEGLGKILDPVHVSG